MGTNKRLTFLFASLGMLILILDSKTALQSGAAGVELCIRTVIPSLFPFLFFSGLLTSALWGSTRLPKSVSARLGIPAGGEALLLSGFLGGYPAGAALIGDFYGSGHLTRENAVHLLSFCSNAGPAFLFGMVAQQFPELWMVWALWGIHILSALLAGLQNPLVPSAAVSHCGKDKSSSQVLVHSLQVMSTICGWILIFRILLGFLDRWVLWLLPTESQPLIWGLLELSNGCCGLAQISDLSLRFVTASVILAFGGLCVALQTASVIGDLPLLPYLRGKLLQTLFSAVLSSLVISGCWPAAVGFAIFMALLPRLWKKRDSIPSAAGV